MSFFVTSRGLGQGGNLGGLAGADAHCQALADAESAGDRTWRAYLSTSAAGTFAAVHARDRIGKGPWYNANGQRIAVSVEDLHRGQHRITKAMALTETFEEVSRAGDPSNRHDIMTGTRPDGTAVEEADDLTCRNWTSSGEGRAQVGHHDEVGQGEGAGSWNSAHPSSGCSQQDLERTGGAGLFYCFAID
jgi:hypothetical protein